MPDTNKELKQYGLKKHSEILKQEGHKLRPDLVQQKNRNSSQGSFRKTTQSTKQRLDSILYHAWVDSINNWITVLKEEYTYDASGNLTQFLDYEWDDANIKWVASYKREYTYDAGGNQTLYLRFDWDDATTKWVASRKSEFTCDAGGNPTQYLDYEWDDANSKWVADYKSEYTYDADGNLTQYLDYEWDDANSKWVADDKAEYTYDANGNPTFELYYYLGSTNELTVTSKYIYTYDLSFNLSDLIIPSIDWFLPDYSYKIINKPLGYSTYNWNEAGNDWADDDKGIYYYSEQNVTLINDIEMEKIRLYPNPASEYITFSLEGRDNRASFELFDIQGRKVLNKKIKNGENVSLAEVNKGIYFYYLVSDGHTQSGKLIKE